MIGDSIEADEKNGFLMNVNDQITYAWNQIKNDSNLTDGFNAVGFSQGTFLPSSFFPKPFILIFKVVNFCARMWSAIMTLPYTISSQLEVSIRVSFRSAHTHEHFFHRHLLIMHLQGYSSAQGIKNKTVTLIASSSSPTIASNQIIHHCREEKKLTYHTFSAAYNQHLRFYTYVYKTPLQ